MSAGYFAITNLVHRYADLIDRGDLAGVGQLFAHGTMDTAFNAIEMGAFDYVTKPCEIADLVAKIEAAHARKRAREGQD